MRNHIRIPAGITHPAAKRPLATCRAMQLRHAAGRQICPNRWRRPRKSRRAASGVSPDASDTLLLRPISVLSEQFRRVHGIPNVVRHDACAGFFVAAGALCVRGSEHVGGHPLAGGGKHMQEPAGAEPPDEPQHLRLRDAGVSSGFGGEAGGVLTNRTGSVQPANYTRNQRL